MTINEARTLDFQRRKCKHITDKVNDCLTSCSIIKNII